MNVHLGIDVGAISTKLVAIDPGGDVQFKSYRRGYGNPIRSVQEGLVEVRKALGDGACVLGMCTTGSAGRLIGEVLGADVVKNEISAHARAVLRLYPDVRTIFEIGGQDSKVTIVRDGRLVDFAMNVVCAAGTGSFLDSQARRLNLSIEELSEEAMLSQNPTPIAGRCTVFAESDMVHKQQIGHRQRDIIMGLCQALVRNYLSNVCRGKEILPPMVLQGGVSANPGIRRAFQQALQTEIIVPQHNMVMGAYGAALIAADSEIESTRFRGFEISDRKIHTASFHCRDCANRCEILEIVERDAVISRGGGRCRKWDSSVVGSARLSQDRVVGPVPA